MSDVDKTRLKARFARGLATYRQAAHVQAMMAGTLMDALAAVRPERHFWRILELGCGDGLLTSRIEETLSYGQLTLVDIVPACADCHCHRPRAQFTPGDMETMPLPEADLVLAGAVFQWAADLPGLLRRLQRLLSRDGLLAFSTFGPDNLREIAALTGRSLSYSSLADLVALLQASQFTVLAAREEHRVLFFPNATAVLEHLRDTGVNGVKSGKPWTRHVLRDFSERYQQDYAGADGRVPLSYHPLWIVAQKNPSAPAAPEDGRHPVTNGESA